MPFQDNRDVQSWAQLADVARSTHTISLYKVNSAVPRCAQPLAPFDCGCIAIKKYIFDTTYYS